MALEAEARGPEFSNPVLAWRYPVELPLEKDADLGRGDFLVHQDEQTYLIRLTERGMTELGDEDASADELWKSVEEEGLV